MAGALANGPKDALGEDVHVYKLGKRKAPEDVLMKPHPKKIQEEVEPTHSQEQDEGVDSQASQVFDKLHNFH